MFNSTFQPNELTEHLNKALESYLAKFYREKCYPVVDKFKEDCILGRYVGLEVLGRLLYSTYDEDNGYFDSVKVSQLSQLDWSRSSSLWSGNIVTIDPNPKNSAKPYKISVSISTVKIAVDKVKIHLGWTQPPNQINLF